MLLIIILVKMILKDQMKSLIIVVQIVLKE